MMSGCLGISCKVAALLFVAWLVQQVALKTGKTNYQPLVSSRIHGVALCPCDKRIKVKVCTEALCIDCQRFVLEHLITTYDMLGSEVMDLQVVPFGNAKFENNRTIACQHGLAECDANTWEQCMIYAFPQPKQYLPMFSCLEDTLPMGSRSAAFPVAIFETCAKQANLDFDPIQQCHDNPALATMVLQQAADATPADHNHVPWVEIDGTYINEDLYDFRDEICKAYELKGGSHPACTHENEMAYEDLPHASVASLDELFPCNKRVKVKICTEALCPGCREFVLEHLIPTFDILGCEVMDVQVVPFGNAKIENKTITCQHGVGECDANTWEQCMIHSFPHPEQYLPMLSCLEDTLPMGSRSAAFPVAIFETCAKQANLDFDPIQQCHDNPALATMVLQQAADATPADHTYVPWVEIDDNHLDMESEDFLEQVCKAFLAKGGSHPACNEGKLTRIVYHLF